MGDNPGVIMTEQMIDAQHRLMTELTTESPDPNEARDAARALRAAQVSAGWSASESEADAQEIIRALLYGDPRDVHLSKPHELSRLLAAAVAQGLAFLSSFIYQTSPTGFIEGAAQLRIVTGFLRPGPVISLWL